MKEKEIDYKLMYHKMVNAAEDAMNILIKAQRECEELYMEAAQPEVEETMDKLEKMSGWQSAFSCYNDTEIE